MSNQSFIVAGAGLAGFSAAIELASDGHQVTLLEKSRQPGGRAATHHQRGFAMNLGPHAFYGAGVMKRQFDTWGISYHGARPLGDGKAFLLSNGVRHVFPLGTLSLLRSGAFSVRDKIRIARALQALQKTDPATVRGQSMQTWIDSHGGSGKAALLLAAVTRLSTYSADLGLLDAGAAIAQLQLASAGSVLYLDGGWETLIAGLARKAQSLGVAVRIECGLNRVEPGLVELSSGERLAADGIVLAIPPRDVEQVTGLRLPVRTPARAACLDLGLTRLPSRAASFVLGLETPTYVSVHSAYARGLAPERGALVHIAKYLDRDATATREDLERLADVALPGWRSELMTSRFLPEMTVVHAIPQAQRDRPDVDALKMQRVRIAGDWVGPEAMLADAAVASGLRAARSLAHAAAGSGDMPFAVGALQSAL
jgi:phytoene dehydrogenase-like protein